MTKKLLVKLRLFSERRLRSLFIGGFLLFIAIGALLYLVSSDSRVKDSSLTSTSTKSVKSVSVNEVVKYSGKDGVDALTLLKQRTSVEQDRSGMVSSINNRRADNAKKEFWSFFINGETAQVGPASYITQDDDQIEWKIQTY